MLASFERNVMFHRMFSPSLEINNTALLNIRESRKRVPYHSNQFIFLITES